MFRKILKFIKYMLPAQAPIRVEIFAAQGASGGAAFVKSANFAAINDAMYHVVATCTVTDPTPVEGKGFEVFVRNGTATVGGTAYSRAGTRILRVFHSGAWANYPVYSPVTVADIPTLSDGTGSLNLEELVTDTLTVGPTAEFNTSTYIFGTGAASALKTALAISSADIADAISGGGNDDEGKVVEYGANGYIFTTGEDSQIYTSGANAFIFTEGENASIFTIGAQANIYTESGFIQTGSTFGLNNGTHTTTLSHNPTADRSITFPDRDGTVALIPTGPYADDAAAATGGVPVGYTYYTAAGDVKRRMA